jgi:hypothetical protein
MLSIPAMSAEVERVLSFTKMLVTERRSKPRVEIIEVQKTTCVKAALPRHAQAWRLASHSV